MQKELNKEGDKLIRASILFDIRPPPLVEDPNRFYRSGEK